MADTPALQPLPALLAVLGAVADLRLLMAVATPLATAGAAAREAGLAVRPEAAVSAAQYTLVGVVEVPTVRAAARDGAAAVALMLPEEGRAALIYLPACQLFMETWPSLARRGIAFICMAAAAGAARLERPAGWSQWIGESGDNPPRGSCLKPTGGSIFYLFVFHPAFKYSCSDFTSKGSDRLKAAIASTAALAPEMVV